MKLSEHPRAIQWLQQFNSADIHVARLIVDSLKLVSFSEFEAAILNGLARVLDATEGKIALFTIDQDLDEPTGLPGSEFRLRNSFTNFSRIRGDRILIQPTDDEMFDQKVDAIVLVDDFIASGTRFQEFWTGWNPKRIKSWLSFKYCNLWVVGYAIHRTGLDKITQICGVDPSRLLFEVQLETQSEYWPEIVMQFLEIQAERTTHVPFSSNFGGIQCPLVFQHGCPDNAPAILIKSGASYQPLFKNRGVDPTFYPCFDDYTDSWRSPDLLLRGGQPLLAAKLAKEILAGTGEVQIQMLTVLGLLVRGVSVARLASVMTASENDLKNLIESCKCLGVIDQQCAVTPFGRDLVQRSKKRFTPRSKVANPTQEAVYYVPKQFNNRPCGAQ